MLLKVPLMVEPFPFPGIPGRLVWLVLDQLIDAPEETVILICVIAVPEQMVCVDGEALTVGEGVTVTEVVVE